MNDINAHVTLCRQLMASGKSRDEVVASLRAQGCSKIISMTILVKVLGIQLNEAKEIVHNSSAWRDVQERDEQFQKNLEEGISGSDKI
ncbi:MAG: hypothetical protein SFY92_04260 [Verrucomicrobiae bacterium]|nr:hypothetical protein [Verrucomicrobiae bacterium]